MKSCIRKTQKEIAKSINKKFSDSISNITEDGYIYLKEGSNPIELVNRINEHLGGDYVDIMTTLDGEMILKITPGVGEKQNMIDENQAEEERMYFEDITNNLWVDENGEVIDIGEGEFQDPVEEDPFEAAAEEMTVEDLIDEKTEKALYGTFKTLHQYLQGRIGELKKNLSIIEQRIKQELEKGNTEAAEELYSKIADIKSILNKLQYVRARTAKYKGREKEFQLHNIFALVEIVAKAELNYAEKLIENKDAIDLSKAKDIIEYYIKVGEIIFGQEHPLLKKEAVEAMVKASDNDEIGYYREQLKKIGQRALELKNRINLIKADIIENMLSQDSSLMSVISKYKKDGDDRLIDILRRPLEDISLYDMMMHDISTVVFSRDSLLAQVIKKTAMDIMEEERGNIVELLSRFSELQERVEKKLEKHGIPGFKAHDYSIFFQKDKYGFITGRLIGPFKNEWYNEIYKNVFSYDLYENDHVPARDEWIDNNAEKIDLTRIKAVREKYKNNGLFTDDNGKSVFDKYSDEEAEKYEQELRKKLGDKYVDNIIADSLIAIEEFIAQAEIAYNNYYKTPEGENKKKAMENYQIFIRRNNPVLASISNSFTYNDKMYSRSLDGVFLMPKNEKFIEKDFFDKIVQDQDLYEMWTVLSEGFAYVSQSFSDSTMSYPKDNIPSMRKTFLEMIMGQGRSGVLDNAKLARKEMKDAFKRSIRSTEEKHIEAKDKYGINKNFYDAKRDEVKALFNRYVDRWKSLSQSEEKETAIRLSDMSTKQIEFLQEITGLTKDEMYSRFGSEELNINSILYAAARQNVVLQYSTDIPMVFRASVSLAAEYNARVRMKPVIDILMEEYKQIERKRTEQGGSKFERFIAKITGRNKRAVERERAIKRMEWWYDKAVRGQFDTKEKGLFKGFKGLRYDNKKWFRGLLRFLATGKIYTTDEKRAVGDLEKKMDKIKDKVIAIIRKYYGENEEDVDKLNSKIDRVRRYRTIKIKDKKLTEEEQKLIKEWNYMAYNYGEIGANFSLSAFVNSIFGFLIFKGLAYNVNSAIRNRAEGWMANMIIDSTGRFWTPGNMTYANFFMNRAYKARLAPGSDDAKQWKIFDHIMIDYRILQDASNELQKNSIRSSIKNIDKASPYYLSVTAIEKRNQGAIVLSIMMDMTIKDKNGNEYAVFDGKKFTAFEVKDGRLRLKEEFRTKENIETWEKQRSKKFIEFKRKVEKAIVHTHGDYTQLGGMWIKSQDWGRALMMFKTWLPQYIWQRFAKYQYDIIADTEIKGRFRSFTKTTGALAGAIGGILMGPGYAALGAGIGFLWSVNNGITTDVNIVKELVGFSKLIVKQWLNLPASLFGKRIFNINEEEIQKYFSKDKKMSKIDAMNLAANAQEIAIILWLILLKMLIKSIGWDDDDDKKENNWKWRTYLVLENHITNLIETGAQYANPKMFFKNNASISFLRWLENVDRTVKYIQDTFAGKAYFENGPYKGEFKLARQAKRLFVPTFADGFMFGFQSPSRQDYSQNDFFDKLFKSGK